MSNRRIRTATTFGVDRTGPVISRLRPSEPLVLNEQRRFASTSRIRRSRPAKTAVPWRPEVIVRAGATSGSNVYWTTTADVDGETVEINIDPATGTDVWGNNYFAREIEHTVYAIALDEVGNSSGWVSFTFTRDHTDPALSLSAVPSNFGATTAKSVSVTVAGTLSDATEIRRSFLSIHKGASCDAAAIRWMASSGERSGAAAPQRHQQDRVLRGVHGQAGRRRWRADYCFYLSAEDDARDADDRAAANMLRRRRRPGRRVQRDVACRTAGTAAWPDVHVPDCGRRRADPTTLTEVNEGSMATYGVSPGLREPTARRHG